MTVHELIDRLKTMPQTLPVCFSQAHELRCELEADDIIVSRNPDDPAVLIKVPSLDEFEEV